MICTLFSYTNRAWKERITNCSISGENVGSFNTGNTLQGTDCTIDKETAREEVDRQVGHGQSYGCILYWCCVCSLVMILWKQRDRTLSMIGASCSHLAQGVQGYSNICLWLSVCSQCLGTFSETFQKTIKQDLFDLILIVIME